ncbi:A disintegrin and metalloproteinase with thrombospondin motifs 7-like [Neocloeon triangulifer]|uniref:A disintegrin and metalloproteinase with thrombospondin motifs 7-like n=1 Tax=Neocloeon triangulifer TaxID=2078957 RepID=UPI00286F9A40|nr:A disintegrin and metalloproteinase with thrombospondin motifs 7-like [Neocloeon triangulifer]
MTCTLNLLLLLIGSAAAKGIFSDEAYEYEVVVPMKVDAAWASPSAEVTHHHRLHPSRSRRAADEHKVRFELRDSAALRLELWPSVEFISPRLRVHRPVSRSRRSVGNFHTCHYQGIVHGEPDSKVALSACDGLAGMVRSAKYGTLWIEPIRNGGVKGHQHVIYKRPSSTKTGTHSCGTEDPIRVFKKSEGRKRLKRSSRNLDLFEQLEDNGLVPDGPLAGPSAKNADNEFSVSRERNVEVMVVADRSMMDFHDKESATDLETYLLTVMNMVSSFYRIPSLGNRVNIVVAKLRVEDENLLQNGQSFNVTTNADVTLDSFCAWQRKLNNPDDDHPDHHDVAILLTRVDICSKSDKPCGTLGVAHVGGMCDLSRACSVNQDNGLSVAHTVAHELGHNFGMVHDAGEESNNADDCLSRNGTALHIMTPNFDVDTTSMEWSSCSRKTITRFFDKGDGECLNDLPTNPEGPTELPDLPAGALYDADHQCRLQYSSLATSVCSEEEDFCSYLWCTVNDTCTTTLRPPADGTNCGHRKWCMSRECVDVRDSPVAVDGGWGEWGPFSECSRTCGGGVASSERECDHPRPAHGGLYCTGVRKRYRICNTKPCWRSEKSFRGKQCAVFDPDWRPYFDRGSPCALFCTNESLIVEAAPAAKDGTPCNSSSNDMCIEGKCRRVGCDWKVDSAAEEDACGVCNGDGSQCITHSNHFGRKEGKGVQVIADVPAESHNIRVEETANSRTFIALGASEKRLYVDGRRLGKGESQDIPVAGSVATYQRWGHRETLTLRGPTNEALHIYVIYAGKARNLGVRYEFTVRRKPGERASEFHWQFPEWSACSVTCGSGMQIARPQCVERHLSQVDSVKCLSTGPPPNSLTKTCTLPPCPARWWSGPWQLCPVTCGPWITRRHRTVLCVRNIEEGPEFQALPDEDCDQKTKPQEEEPCPGLPKCDRFHSFDEFKNKSSIRVASTTRPVRQRPIRRHRKRAEARIRSHHTRDEKRFRWHTGEWTHCSKTCGDGIRKRGVTCVLSQTGHRVAVKHCPGKKPADYEPCIVSPCSQWTVGAWTECDCDGTGKSTRTVSCPRLNECSEQNKPETSRSCFESCLI